jgi:hypothetical protein
VTKRAVVLSRGPCHASGCSCTDFDGTGAFCGNASCGHSSIVHYRDSPPVTEDPKKA